jgi:hypothetical protein
VIEEMVSDTMEGMDDPDLAEAADEEVRAPTHLLAHSLNHSLTRLHCVHDSCRDHPLACTVSVC